ncbi:putative photosynthetic complex assembly protein PuhE [Prosthecomicrobium hirschii]|uniref:putative photosynthetic complex assembly protein PuhE n=1 Tax=Prosthecodimorpha hirschii TaxID=665126 RepID=UPI0009FB02A1|nr:putative photosynthetic complex assembly protein PuhE [Prosthecomicrobium hirschii]
MNATGLAIAHALFLWWFGTGIVLYLDGLPRRTFPWTVAGATALLGLALWGLAATRDDSSVTGAHLAFAAAIAVWAWNEILFLTGFVTGPRRGLQAAGDRGWRRFAGAAGTVLYHELLLAASLLVVAQVVAGGTNPVGFWTFLTLWGMRLSTKVNIFLGVRNLSESFLPDHLAYLASYFRRAPMNPFFPVSLVLSSALFAGLVAAAIAPETGAFLATAVTLIATLVGLAILEHGFLVLPLDVAALWRWGFRSRRAGACGHPPVLTCDPPPRAAADHPPRSV